MRQSDLDAAGRLLRDLRHRRGWKLWDLAERAGVSATTISRIEHGQHGPRLRILAILCEELEASPTQVRQLLLLYGFIPPETPEQHEICIIP